uniref:permease prefix domain 1-containing protein n=1 Tax=Deinococcus sp. TaxID=47478 RepID=UPI002869876A
MNVVERYLKRATRGLWGQKKRDATTELRGAIEDKIYRHRLCGLSAIEAERAALRDLGSPALISRDLNRVHTGPQVMRLALLLGVAGVLGVHAAAQLPMIHAAPVPLAEACRYDEAKLAQFSSEDRAMVRARIDKAGGRANYEAACRVRNLVAVQNDLLSLPDLISALRAAKVEVQTLPGLDSYLQLRLPGGDWQGVILTGATVDVPTASGSAQTYVFAAGLINVIRGSFTGEVRVSGTVNPVLHIGPARMQLGTAERPVQASNLHSFAVADELTRLMNSASATRPRLNII